MRELTEQEKSACESLGVTPEEYRAILDSRKKTTADQEIIDLIDGEIRYVWSRTEPPVTEGGFCQVSNGFEFVRATFVRWVDGTSRRAAIVENMGTEIVAHDPDDAW